MQHLRSLPTQPTDGRMDTQNVRTSKALEFDDRTCHHKVDRYNNNHQDYIYLLKFNFIDNTQSQNI